MLRVTYNGIGSVAANGKKTSVRVQLETVSSDAENSVRFALRGFHGNEKGSRVGVNR